MKILVLDHDPAAAALLERHCRAILGARLEHFAAADSLPGAAALLAGSHFDTVLLDPHLPWGDALDFLATRTGRDLQVIIVSAHTELSLRAFEFGVLDFVPKPVARERLARALRRVPAHPQAAAAPDQFLAVRRLGRIDLVAVDDVLYAEGAGKYTELVLTNGTRSLHDKTLGRLAATLPASFVRIHKSYLVRLALVSRLRVLKGSRYFAELRTGHRLPVGRSHYARLKSHLLGPHPALPVPTHHLAAG